MTVYVDLLNAYNNQILWMAAKLDGKEANGGGDDRPKPIRDVLGPEVQKLDKAIPDGTVKS